MPGSERSANGWEILSSFNLHGPEESRRVPCGRKPPQSRRRRHARAGLAAEQQRVRKMVSFARSDRRFDWRGRQRGKSLLQPLCHAIHCGRVGLRFVFGRHIASFQPLQCSREAGTSRSQIQPQDRQDSARLCSCPRCGNGRSGSAERLRRTSRRLAPGRLRRREQARRARMRW